ncbi:hypothetical protein WMY93_015151 [Mugilogobius chulae]|uniref:AIG1-type G domain-containing protein n=1 Tax=Mugilogobius chulae TaxID=88201 RepID=A0AAW0P978_9GOBI
MQEPRPLRVVLVGKHGSGKSSLANSLLGEVAFNVSHGSDTKIRRSEARTKVVDGQSVTVIDTPGIVERLDRQQQCEWMSCLVQCAPGPDALLLVLPVQRFTQQERALVQRVKMQFGEQVLRFTTVVFTHGDQLPENMRIMEFVEQSAELHELVQACGGRCHVVDHKYWNKEKPEGDPHRSNAFQLNAIMESVKKTARDNQKHFSNDTLERLEREIQTEQSRIHSQGGLSSEESRDQAKNAIIDKYIEEATKRPPHLKYAVVAGIAGVAAVAAVFVLPKVIKWLSEKPPLPILEAAPIDIPTVLPSAPEHAQEVVGGVVKEGVQGVQEVVGEVVQEGVQGVQEVVGEVVQEGVQGVQEVVGEVVKEVKEVVGEVVKEGVQGVQEVVGEVVKEVQEAVKEVVKFILREPEDLFENYDPFNLFEW